MERLMKPILFNTEMVRAILAGRKTVTRRVVRGINNTADFLELTKDPSVIAVDKHGKEYPKDVEGLYADFAQDGNPEFPLVKAPYRPGDILYVRETWCDPSGTGYPFLYKADMPMHWDAEDTEIGVPVDMKAEDYTWRPSIHMPREAARLFLRAKSIRVERLRAMGMEDALKEGVVPTNRPGGCRCQFAVDGCMEGPCANRAAYEIGRHLNPFIQLWDSTIKTADRARFGWAADPWVWVIEFERIAKEMAGEALRARQGADVPTLNTGEIGGGDEPTQ